MGHDDAYAHQAPTSALDLAAPAERPHGDDHESDAHGLWDVLTNTPNPNCLLANRPPLHPQTTPAQNCSSPWQTAGAWGQRLPPTPATARRMVSHAPPLWLRRSASGCHRLLAGPGHRPPLASRLRGRPPGRGQYNRLAASTAPPHAPFLGVKVASQRLAYLL